MMTAKVVTREELHGSLTQGKSEVKLTIYGDCASEWAILICPGGGYGVNAEDREGHPVAKAFVEGGHCAAVLAYSLTPPVWNMPLLEATAAISYLRRQGAKKIAVCGFSAGGHLAGCTGNFWRDGDVAQALGLTPEEMRPDAVILSYAVVTTKPPLGSKISFDNLVGAGQPIPPALALEDGVLADNPPAFLWATVSDASVPVENTLLYANALQGAKVPFELHLFPKGPHAMALADERTEGRPEQQDSHVANWFPLCLQWLETL